MKWKKRLVDYVVKELYTDMQSNLSNSNKGIHLAIFSEPYLTLLLEGKKTIESRFSVNKISPHGKIQKGDIILLKKTGGPIVGYFIAEDVEFFQNLNREKLNMIKKSYSEEICADVDPSFWSSREESNYATLVKIQDVHRVSPFQIEKRDRSAWVILLPSMTASLF